VLSACQKARHPATGMQRDMQRSARRTGHTAFDRRHGGIVSRRRQQQLQVVMAAAAARQLLLQHCSTRCRGEQEQRQVMLGACLWLIGCSCSAMKDPVCLVVHSGTLSISFRGHFGQTSGHV
jgi:hypothetical protein